MVEGASEIVKSIPTNGDNLIGDLSNADEVIAALKFVRIGLDSDVIWAGAEESLTSQVQIRDVLLGPFDFYEDQPRLVKIGPRKHVRKL